VQFSRKPLSYVGATSASRPVEDRALQCQSTPPGYPRCRRRVFRKANLSALPSCTRPFLVVGSATQHGAFPLRTAFWVRSASPFQDDDPRPFALISFKSTAPRSDSWHRFGRNFAHAYIRTYLRVASGRALHSLLLALSSASVALFQPYLSRWTIPGLPESLTHLPHRVVRTHLGTTEWYPNVFAPIVRARPCSVFGRPVHLSG
jgi:hypothetical protein